MSETPGPPDPNAGTPAEPPPSAPSYGSPPPASPPPAPPPVETPAPAPGYGTPAPPAGAPASSPPPATPGYSTTAARGLSDSDRRMWAMLGHLGGIIISFVAPLIVYLIYKDQDEFIKDQSKEALNFQITVLIGYVIASVLSAVGIGFLLYPLIWVANVVFCIIAGMAANRGERYRYPFALRFVK
jgi:uncharacterized Tic20 family protein